MFSRFTSIRPISYESYKPLVKPRERSLMRLPTAKEIADLESKFIYFIQKICDILWSALYDGWTLANEVLFRPFCALEFAAIKI